MSASSSSRERRPDLSASSRGPVGPTGLSYWLTPLRPLAIGIVAYLVALLVASRTLPVHTIVIWQSAGSKALAASRSDFEVGVLATGAVILVAYLVAAALMALVPTRHVLVPHAAYWKTPDHRAEMRRRYAVYLGRAFCFTYVFIAVEIVVAIVSQSNRAFEVSWLPQVVSLLFVVVLLIYAVWVFADGFRVPRRPAPAQRPPSGSTPGGRGRA